MSSVFKNRPFHHRHLENFIVAFGNAFSGITIRKLDANKNKKQSYEVPIEYAPKNKWISRIREQNDLTTSQVKITLPRMAFEMTDIRYAPDRKIGVNGTYVVGDIGGLRGKIYPPTPYDVIFDLYVMTKDQVDSQQILEQIVPYFQPYMFVNYEILPEYQIKKDVPITIQAYQTEDTYAGSPEDQRTVTQIFTFAAQMDFFGPMMLSSSIIKDEFINFGYEFGKPKHTTIELKVDPLYANKSDTYTIIETKIEVM